jgi:hypothetical protein
MTEFACSGCDYISNNKTNVERHINRKISCGPGKKEIIEIPKDIICKYCDKKYATVTSLKNHMRYYCKQREIQLELENEKLKQKIKELELNQKIVNNNNTFNDNRTFNIIILNYEETKTELSDKTYNNLLSDTESVHQIIPSLIRTIHFDPKMPENHNIYIKNKNNKYMHMFKNNQWELVNKESEIDNIINDKETMLSDWADQKGDKYPEAVERFNEYLGQKNEEEISKLMKEEVELMLYNNRHIIKN